MAGTAAARRRPRAGRDRGRPRTRCSDGRAFLRLRRRLRRRGGRRVRVARQPEQASPRPG